MFKAVTLIETLITFVILVIALYFIQAHYFYLSNKVKIENEAELVRSFFYQIKNYTQYTRKDYKVTLSQDSEKWCVIATQEPFAKKSDNKTACNCLNLKGCHLKERYFYYKNSFNTHIKSNSLYPKIFMHISGISGNLETQCLGINLEKEKLTMAFDPYGVIHVPAQDNRSKCN